MIRFPNHPLPAQTGYSGPHASPAAITAAVAVHALVVGAVLLMPPQVVDIIKDPFIRVRWIEPETSPPPPTPPAPEPKSTHAKPAPTADPPVNPEVFPPLDPTAGGESLSWPTGGTGEGGTVLPVDPPTPPVLVDAQPDPARMTDFQPPYPPSMVRAQMEGFATVRVHITPQGRVDAVERIDATNDAFWRATREQALSRWRFKPATRDGIAIESKRIMTVRFRLD